MKKLQSSILAAATLLAGLAAPALANTDSADGADAKVAKRVDDVFARLDADKDGRLSRAEAAKGKRLAKHFDKIDADHDGFVSRTELDTAIHRRIAHAKAKG
jgi:Ca2+-binding EF-hand superfamily protein